MDNNDLGNRNTYSLHNAVQKPKALSEWELYYPHLRNIILEKFPYKCVTSSSYDSCNNQLFFNAFRLGVKALFEELICSPEFRSKVTPEEFYNILQEISK